MVITYCINDIQYMLNGFPETATILINIANIVSITSSFSSPLSFGHGVSWVTILTF